MNEFLSINDTNTTLDDELNENKIESTRNIAVITNICIMVIGMINNTVSICAFLKKNLLKKKFNWYLLISTIFELIFCSTVFIDYISGITIKQLLHEFNEISRIIIDLTVHTSDSCIVIMTLFLSLDRLYAIKHPLEIKEYFTNLHAKLTISLSLLILIILNILSYSLCEMNIFNDVHIVYCALVSPLIFNTIPLIIIFIINLMLVFEIVCYYKNKQSRANSIDKSNKDNSVNIERIDFTTATVTQRTSKHVEKKFNKKQSRANSSNNNRELVPMRVELLDLKNNQTSIRIHNSINKDKNLSLYQKSHYLVILITALWSVMTSIPYYSFKSFFLLVETTVFTTDLSDSTINKVQITTSILLNFNHCINFFIYLSFYDDFRLGFRNFFPEF